MARVNDLSPGARRARSGQWLLTELRRQQELHYASPSTQVVLARLDATGVARLSEPVPLEALDFLEDTTLLVREGGDNQYVIFVSQPEAFAGFYVVPNARTLVTPVVTVVEPARAENPRVAAAYSVGRRIGEFIENLGLPR